MKNVMVCAHRGLSLACPENTLPAFGAAIAVGAHEIEFDVWTSSDGKLVVCHDESVERTTDGAGRVTDLSWQEIRSLDAGIRSGPAWRGVQIPCVEEVLDVADGRVGLNIHIKSVGLDGATVKRVCDILTERAFTDIAYIALGTEAALSAALEYAPEVARACLMIGGDRGRAIDTSLDLAERYACQRIQFSRAVTQEQVRRAHDLGLICNLFWSDDPEDGREYVKKGIDVILTNCAHTMIAGGFDGISRD